MTDGEMLLESADGKEKTYRSYLDATPDLVCIKDEGLRYLLVNEAYSDLIGKSQEEVAGRRASDIFRREVAWLLEKMDLRVLASQEAIIEDVKIGKRIFEVRMFPMKLGGEIAIAECSREITERKRAEEALLSEKTKFQRVCDNTPFGIVLVDHDHRLKYMNPKFRELFGYDLDDIPDGETWFRRALPELEYDTEVTSLWIGDNGGHEPYEKKWKTRTVICKDGTQRKIHFTAVQMATGEYVISCEDMTEAVDREKRATGIVNRDELTGLPNRSSMEKAVRNAIDHAREARKKSRMSALLFMDIEAFNALNDRLGREAGDGLLVTLSKLLKSILRSGDYVYRFGGARFVVLFRSIGKGEARLASERIQKTVIGCNFPIGPESVRLDLALGLVPIDGSMGLDALLSAGEQAMQHAKTLGRSQLAIHEPDERPLSGTGTE
jgi:diguanylate cyclase (GGDEF)-like protein/PAS domain S-box-containing protein